MAFSFYRTITIDPSKVGGSNQSNFPVLVSGTYAYLATVANGGKVQNANGYDVGFYSDAALTTKLDWEIELYTAATGVVVYWVRVPTVSSSVNTVIYMAYGDASISTNQSNATGVWDSNYEGVWHLPNGSVLTANDSTSNGNNGSLQGTNQPSAVTGKVDGGASFDGGTGDLIRIPDVTSMHLTTTTMQAWVKTSSANGGIYGRDHDVTGSAIRFMTDGSGNALLQTFNAAGSSAIVTFSGSISDNVWHFVVATTDGSTMTISVDGASPTSAAGNIIDYGGSYNFAIGSTRDVSGVLWTGSIDEMRVSKAIRSANWITGEYNNQNSPSTFYAVGNETPTFTFLFTPIVQPNPSPIKVVGY